MPIMHKAHALDQIQARAADIYQKEDDVEAARDRFKQAVKEAKKNFPRLTQQEIADKTVFEWNEDDIRSLSRQRIQQIITEES